MNKKILLATAVTLSAGFATTTFGATDAQAGASNLSSANQNTARKWCGPGGRLCIENGRWTWKPRRRRRR